MLEEWSLFLAEYRRRGGVCIMEGHGWQPMAEFMHLAGYPQRDVIGFCDDVASIISPLNPIVIYYSNEDVANHLERLEQLRGREWVELMEERDTLHHGLKKFGGSLLRFWREWAVLQEVIFSRCPFPKLRIRNPHGDWEGTYMSIRRFLQIE
jgi:hypothetical protein